ncbi:DUF3127 domain-containing protein [Dyadobacter sediminis]|uniref:DUF3127 domain-containing protein n=1 Tax=Dyadobacter sediminis TaxID=1493691 RepID=A0A5R9K5U2_9BACT|nr:DUF3127 domain-containing protein [Dyadobacter sediminis]TLU89022.1 DUF3127 domain-containing protein [Dyadobacter sediminis]GGC03525.1 hypothetical protein GCM10011325_33140 [Dyadobacter sediminis]
MELTGTVIALLPEVSGQGKNGTWRKQEFILEIPSQYPKKVCIALWGDKIDQANLKVNETVTASIDVESREYNSRWYTEVKAWKLDKGGSSSNNASSASSGNSSLPPVTTFTEDESDDLPF